MISSASFPRISLSIFPSIRPEMQTRKRFDSCPRLSPEQTLQDCSSCLHSHLVVWQNKSESCSDIRQLAVTGRRNKLLITESSSGSYLISELDACDSKVKTSLIWHCLFASSSFVILQGKQRTSALLADESRGYLERHDETALNQPSQLISST